MKRAKYICIEGLEGVGKSTQTELLTNCLRSKGYSVLQTKEPGTTHSPLTMQLRGIMLDNQYDLELTKSARELISQAIRSIHLERVVIPAMSKYDFIVQDRGILSGYAYGAACGNSYEELRRFSTSVVDAADAGIHKLPIYPEHIYDSVLYLKGDVDNGLKKALLAKKEFATGDAIESRGNQFLLNVSKNMDIMSQRFNTVIIYVDGKSIDEVHDQVLVSLKLKDA